MKYIDAHGMDVPALGLGTWQVTGAECRRVVEKALEIGYRHIDTAQMYENEAEVGAALRSSGLARDDFWVTTKVSPEHAAPKEVTRTTHDSLKRLAVDSIDLLLLHWPQPAVPLEQTLGAMQRLQEEKVVRHIGVSNFTPPLLDEALRLAPIGCLQVEYHPYLGQSQLLQMAQDRDLLFTAYCPLARGKVAQDPVLREIGEAHGKSAPQVALRWLLQQHNVAAVPKASSEAHLRSNFEIFDFELDAEEARRIAQLERGERLINPSFAPQWDAK